MSHLQTRDTKNQRVAFTCALIFILIRVGLTQGQYSYVVKIYYAPLKPAEKPLRCTAAIYNANWVVTSARCALYSWRRKLGKPSHDLGDLLYGAGQEMEQFKPNDMSKYRFIIDAALPPGLNATIEGNPDPNNDIAMLMVNKPFSFNKHFKAIPVATTSKECETSNQSILLGYGVTGGNEPENGWASALRKIDMDDQTPAECKAKFKDFDTENRFCMRPTNKVKTSKDSSCRSDTGGPLIKIQATSLKHAPVPATMLISTLCGVLPISVCDRTDVNTEEIIEYFSHVAPKSKWMMSVAGKQT